MAWDAGIRYYDTSPHYGAGLAEQCFGRLLSSKPQLSVILGTSNPKRPAQYMQQFSAQIPSEFWQTLKAAKLLPGDLPVPA